jgi:hypothetical protein
MLLPSRIGGREVRKGPLYPRAPAALGVVAVVVSAVFAIRGQPVAMGCGAGLAVLINLPNVLDGKLSRKSLDPRPLGRTPASPWWYLAGIFAGLIGAAALPLALAANITNPRSDISIRHELASQIIFGAMSTMGVILVVIVCQQWWAAGRRARSERRSSRST